MGVEVWMITGDHRAHVALEIAREAGIDGIAAYLQQCCRK